MLIPVSSWYYRTLNSMTRVHVLYMCAFCIPTKYCLSLYVYFAQGKHNNIVRLAQKYVSYSYLAAELELSQELCKGSFLVIMLITAM